MNLYEKQELLDSYAYPPNHNYDLSTLEPKGLLSERLDIINNVMPQFFAEGESFLDVGSNKGFFSFYGSRVYKSVTGLDIDLDFINLCNSLKDIFDCNFDFTQTGFRDFIPTKKYDRIMVGNVHHYIFRECSGTFDWIYKLAAISNGLVIIEGPKDMTCGNMKRVFSDQHNASHMQKNFTEEKFFKAMNLFFTTESITPSVNADRYIMVFKRKEDGLNKYEDIETYPVKEILKQSTDTYWTPLIYKSKNNIVCKLDLFCLSQEAKKNLGTTVKFKKRDTCGYSFTESLLWLKIAAISPFANNIESWLVEGDKIIGWTEKDFTADYELCRNFECEKENFIFHCKSQIFYLRQGFIDLDAASINFAYNRETKHRICFDKGAVYPLNILSEKHWDKISGTYMKCVRRSYNTIDKNFWDNILDSFKTKDSQKIEAAYMQAIEMMG